MTVYMSLDFESSIGTSIHGPTFRDPLNDVYTEISAFTPDNVAVVHNPEGFSRNTQTSFVGVDIIVGHNLSFDLCYIWHDPKLKAFILRGGKIWDTQVAEYILTGQQHTFSSLTELQTKYLGQKLKPSRISSLYKMGVGADRIVKASRRCPRLWKLYNEYCVSDGATPLLIQQKQMQLAEKEGMLPIIELYNDYLLSIINMTCSGIHIDVVQCEKTLRDFNGKHLEYLGKAQEAVSELWNDPRLPPFNINSPDHKSAVLFGGRIKVDEKIDDGFYKNGNPRTKKVTTFVQVEGFRVPPSLSTPSKKEGLYATDDGVMKKIAEKTKNYKLKEYCEYQKQSMMYKKAAKTYCQAFLDRSVNGILYPNFNNTLTSTGRLSSSEPNLQNVSSKHELGSALHRLMIAPEGWVCVEIDFSQLEIWVLAWLSKDPLLTEHLLKGIDLHIVRLGYYNDKPYEELYQLCKGPNKLPEWELARSNAKTVSYQMAYGAQPRKVAASTGLDLGVVETIFRKEAETYQGAAELVTIVQQSINDTATFSLYENIPAAQKRGIGGSKNFGKAELLPIFDKSGNISYNNEELRKIGYWKSPTGKKYHFLETGRGSKYGVQKSFSFTQPKNFPMQGSAADVQAATSAALLPTLLQKADRITMINEIHDSKKFYVRKDVLNPCLKYLKNVIEDVPKLFKERFNIDVPFKFPVEIKIGDNFDDMQVYNTGE